MLSPKNTKLFKLLNNLILILKSNKYIYFDTYELDMKDYDRLMKYCIRCSREIIYNIIRKNYNFVSIDRLIYISKTTRNYAHAEFVSNSLNNLALLSESEKTAVTSLANSAPVTLLNTPSDSDELISDRFMFMNLPTATNLSYKIEYLQIFFERESGFVLSSCPNSSEIPRSAL